MVLISCPEERTASSFHWRNTQSGRTIDDIIPKWDVSAGQGCKPLFLWPCCTNPKIHHGGGPSAHFAKQTNPSPRIETEKEQDLCTCISVFKKNMLDKMQKKYLLPENPHTPHSYPMKLSNLPTSPVDHWPIHSLLHGTSTEQRHLGTGGRNLQIFFQKYQLPNCFFSQLTKISLLPMQYS